MTLKNHKHLPIISNVPIKEVTCFSTQEKYNVDCQRTNCPNWFSSHDNNNCILIAAQKGPRTLQNVGDFFGLTRMRICQIEKSIYQKIKIID